MTHRGVTGEASEDLRGYRLHATLDLKNDARAATTTQVAFALTAAVMVVAAFVLDLPLDSPLSAGSQPWSRWRRAWPTWPCTSSPTPSRFGC